MVLKAIKGILKFKLAIKSMKNTENTLRMNNRSLSGVDQLKWGGWLKNYSMSTLKKYPLKIKI